MRSDTDSWYIQKYLPDNFEQKYGKTDPTQLAKIAKELMPELPNDVDHWPEEILHVILGEIAGFSQPTIFNKEQVANSDLICSNRESVQELLERNKRWNTESEVPPILEHPPEWLIQVVDSMIGRSFLFCPEHPDHKIIWQAPVKRRK